MGSPSYIEKPAGKKPRFLKGTYFLGCFLAYYVKEASQKKPRFLKGTYFLGCFLAYYVKEISPKKTYVFKRYLFVRVLSCLLRKRNQSRKNLGF